MKRIIAVFFTAVMLTVISATAGFAGEIDVLLDKLVEKNVITPLEAQIIKDETAATVSKEIAQGKSYALPDWVQNIKLKGDVRVRYQYERDETDTEARERGRVRYRLGIISKVGDVEVGGGLASGGDDPRSTNQTFSDTFETGDIRLDYAYAKFNKVPYLKDTKVIFGKFGRKDWLWLPTDMLWDGDINPSGFSANHTGAIPGVDELDYFFNTGVWIMDENSHSDNNAPYLYYTQGGLVMKKGKVDAKTAVTHYGFNGVQDRCLDWGAGTNSGSNTRASGACTGGTYMYDYDSIATGTEIGVKKLFGGLPFSADERIAVFAEYVENISNGSIDENAGWAFGTKFGHKKVSKPDTWQVKYQFVRLGRDAFLDALPDSDRRGGGTDMHSHEVAFNYAIAKNVILGLDYYQTTPRTSGRDIDHLLQADLLVKF